MIQNLMSSPASFGGVTQTFFDSIQRMVSGKRLHTAADDPAGSGVVAKIDSIGASNKQAIRATNDGMSIAQSIDATAENTQTNLVEMRKIAVAAATDTVGAGARQTFQDQMDQMALEVDRSASSTAFNGIPLTDGSVGNIDVMASSDSSGSIAIDTADLTATTLGVDSLDLSSSAGALASIDAIDAALEQVGTVRADVGAQHNRLASAAEAGSARVIDQQSAASRIMDLDMAMASSDRVNAQLQLNAATAAKVQSRDLMAGSVAQLLG
jgi:flagellin